jgi:flagellar hook-basal body complex protein FliE
MLLIALALAAAPAAAADPAPPQMQKLLQNCDAHKFETMIEIKVEGQAQPKHSRVKLCGTEGQSDSDWVRTLKDAVAKTEANLQMPKAVRDQIVTALNSEITRLNGAPAGTLAGLLPMPRASASAPPLQGYSALPALPPPREAAPKSPLRDYAALPPMPTAPTAPTRVLIGSLAAPLPALPKPRMQFVCYTPGETGDVPCTGFTRDTMLTVRADEDVPGGTSLRFVRDGDARADVELAQLRKGKTQRLTLPPQVCSHVVGGTLEIRVVRSVPAAGPSGQEVGKDGPYDLRC